MKIGLMIIEIYLEGCNSLKEKRSRLKGLKDKIGRTPTVAVCESDHADSHRQAQLSFVVLSTDQKFVDRQLSAIEEQVETSVQGEITAVHRENL